MKPNCSDRDKFGDLKGELDGLERLHRYRSLVPRRAEGSRLIASDGTSWVNFGSNDYLGYATESCALQATSGSTASALVCGWTDAHQRLAEELADFEGAEAAVLFPSGYAACSGTIATLAREGDLILSDQYNHASLIDGCRLARAATIVYSHSSVDEVQSLLRQHRSKYKRVWIVTDSVFSMDGDIAPIRELCDVAESFDAELVVDEAHATGVLGPTGAGACELLGVQDRVAVRIGTLSKAIGAQGGFVTGPRVVIDYLVNRCRPLIFSTSLSPFLVETARLRISEIRNDSARRDRLRERIERLEEQLSAIQNSLVGTSSVSRVATPIVPVILGACEATLFASERLRERGYYVPAIRPPTVPEGSSRLRISLSANHSQSDVDRLALAIGEIVMTTRESTPASGITGQASRSAPHRH